jgi:hypothetical protein
MLSSYSQVNDSLDSTHYWPLGIRIIVKIHMQLAASGALVNKGNNLHVDQILTSFKSSKRNI